MSNAESDLAHLSAPRLAALQAVAGALPQPSGEDCVLIAVDGIDGSGKTTFADELAAVLRHSGRSTVRVSVDDFHNTRAVRYRRGRDSATGFWLDAFDYDSLRRYVLEPFQHNGPRYYRLRAHDLATDRRVRAEHHTAAPCTMVIVDGLFLHRDELCQYWHYSIFLDVPFETAARRLAERDGSSLDPDDPSMRRHVGAQRLYYAAADPRSRASLLVDNTDVSRPRICDA